jgi:hypothetical protein
VLKSSASVTDKKICINDFLLTEAINILKNDREHRGDYHTLIPEWQKIAEQGGWNVVEITSTVSLPVGGAAQNENRPFSFKMELQPKALTKI